MLPVLLRNEAKRIADQRGTIKLAVFGPGKGSPFFEKRGQAFAVIQKAHPAVRIKFYLIDDLEPQATSDDDYTARVYPAELKQIVWADIILFLMTHHRLSALVEFGLLHTESDKGSDSVFEKCGLAVIDSLEVSRMWFQEARRLMNESADRLIVFSESDLQTCRVASDLALELFERILLERWSKL